MKSWIKDPSQFTSTDPYAKALKQKFGLQMPGQAHLSDADMEELITFISK